MKRVGAVSTAFLLFVFMGATAFGYPQHGQQSGKQGKAQKQTEPAKQKGKAEKQAEPAKEPAKQEQQDQHKQQAAKQQEQQDQNKLKQQRVQPQQDLNRQRQQQNVKAQQKQTPPGWAKGKKEGWGGAGVPPGQNKQGRLPQERQRQLIQEQQHRLTVYRQHLEQQQTLAQQQAAQLQQQKRMAQYRFQQAYWENLRQQQIRIQNANNYNYNNDAYFYTVPNYRYQRGGTYYETNDYGVNVLRQAVNSGYDQGFRAGQADRQDRWRSNYQDSYAYQDANYGYNGYYVAQDDYNYYFREGFRRGYEDGYNSRYQYGQSTSGKYSILGNILTQILGLQPIR